MRSPKPSASGGAAPPTACCTSAFTLPLARPNSISSAGWPQLLLLALPLRVSSAAPSSQLSSLLFHVTADAGSIVFVCHSSTLVGEQLPVCVMLMENHARDIVARASGAMFTWKKLRQGPSLEP